MKGESILQKSSINIKKLTIMGLFIAISFIFSLVESALPSLPFLPPNIKLGLSNIIVMYTVFFIGKSDAYLIVILKSLFITVTKGFFVGVISFGGGLFSISVIILSILIFKNKITYVSISILGAIGHNIGQIIVASIQFKTNLFKIYWPFLLITGTIFGTLTGVFLTIILPLFKNFHKDNFSQNT